MNPIPTSERRFVTATENDDDLNLDALLIDDLNSQSRDTSAPATIASWSPRPVVPIKAIEEDIDPSNSEWILPAPSKAGDFLSNSMHRVPSKSILKKTSSYGNFDDSTSPSTPVSTINKKPSNASFEISAHSGVGSASVRSKTDNDYALGFDLDNSSQSQMSTPFSGMKKNVSTPAFVSSASVDGKISNGDVAAGVLDVSGSLSASGGKMRRNVSFNAVSVREYGRCVGDNPSCSSGPPLSLDWSYSKASVKSVDDYELERVPERVGHPGRLRLNKYTRRNMLTFHWGHSEEELKEARNKTKKLQRQRSLTQTLLPVHLAHEVCIGIKGFVTKKNKKTGLSGDEMSELSLSTSKHMESISSSMKGGGVENSVNVPGSPKAVYAPEVVRVTAPPKEKPVSEEKMQIKSTTLAAADSFDEA